MKSISYRAKAGFTHCFGIKFSFDALAAFQNASIQSLYAVLNYVDMQSYQKKKNASTINPMPDCFLTALKIHIDDVLK